MKTVQKLRVKIQAKLENEIKLTIQNNPSLIIDDSDENVALVMNKLLYKQLGNPEIKDYVEEVNTDVLTNKPNYEHVRPLSEKDEYAIRLIKQAQTNNDIAQLAWNELHEMYTGSTRVHSMYDNGVFKTLKDTFRCGLLNGEIRSAGRPLPVKAMQAVLIEAIKQHKLHW